MKLVYLDSSKGREEGGTGSPSMRFAVMTLSRPSFTPPLVSISSIVVEETLTGTYLLNIPPPPPSFFVLEFVYISRSYWPPS